MVNYDRLLRVARGDEAADLVIRNANLLNVVTRDAYPATVGICEDTIAYVTEPGDLHTRAHEEIDGSGMWLAPGLIDSHMHIESTHVTPHHFANAVLPRGVTTVAQDPHEIANVLGVDGVQYMLDASRGLPLRVLTFVPTCVPSVPHLESGGATFGPKEIKQLLEKPGVIGLAEVMDYWGVIRQEPRITEIVKVGRKAGVILTGHIRGLGGRQLNTYLAAGIDSDHEQLDPGGILARSRLGMTVEIVCSVARDTIPAAVQSWKARGHIENVAFVTDDIPPHQLVSEGHLDRGVRRAIQLGMEPVDAVRAATLVPADRLRRPDLGRIGPGRTADILLIDDIDNFRVQMTIAGGQIVARDGQMVQPAQQQAPPPDIALNSMHLDPTQPADFRIDATGQEVTVQVITERGRGRTQRQLGVVDGQIDWQSEPDLALVSVWHRHGHNDNHFSALLASSGLQDGALAATYAHDSHNLLVMGRNPRDMALAANTLIEEGGGYTAVRGGEVMATIPLPVAGQLADMPVTELARYFEDYLQAAAELGVPEKPLRLLSSLALPVVPAYRPTDMGLVDVERQQFIDLIIPA